MRNLWRKALLFLAAAVVLLTVALAADEAGEQCPQPKNVRIITEPTVISVTQWDGNVVPTTFYPGAVVWDDMGEGYNYLVKYFRKGDGENSDTLIFETYVPYHYYEFGSFDRPLLSTGDYYATVTAEILDESSSVPVATEIWHYTRSQQLSTPSGLAWNDMTAFCEAVPGADRYNFQVYFSETETGGYIWNGTNYLSDAPQRDLREAFEELGNGYYYFTVRAESNDITVALDSDWSAESIVYHQNKPVLPVPTGFRVVTEKESITYTENGEARTDTLYPGYVTWDWDPNATHYILTTYEEGWEYPYATSWEYNAPYCNLMEYSDEWMSGTYTVKLQAADETGAYTSSDPASLTYVYSPGNKLSVPEISVSGRSVLISPNEAEQGWIRSYYLLLHVVTETTERDFGYLTEKTTFTFPDYIFEENPGAAFTVTAQALSADQLQYRDSNFSGSYSVNLPTLSEPENLTWVTEANGQLLVGTIQFTEGAVTEGNYLVEVYQGDNTLVGSYQMGGASTPGKTYLFDGHLYDLPDPGWYYFTVTSLPVVDSPYSQSMTVRSPDWRYDPPEKYTTVSSATWQGDAATWDYPVGVFQADGLLLEVWAGLEADNLDWKADTVLIHNLQMDRETIEMDYWYPDYGAFFVSFRVRLISSDLSRAAHGDWVWSETIQVQTSDIKTAQDIAALKNQESLRDMQTALLQMEVEDKLSAWEAVPETMRETVTALERQVGAQVTVKEEDNETSSVQVVGLGLSAESASDPVTLTVTQEPRLQLLDAPAITGDNFQSATNVTFSATNVKSELVIPVQISLPVSTDNPDQLRLYKGDNLDEVPIILADGYVRFAVADLSETYVLAEANLLGEVTVNDKTVTVIAQAPTGTTLYAASYDEGGRMRDVATAPVAEGQISYTLSLTPGTSVRVFLLDDNQMPLCQTKVIEKS